VFVVGLVRLYSRKLLGWIDESSRYVLDGRNRAGDSETKGVGLIDYTQAVLYSSSDGRIVSMRATVDNDGEVDGGKSRIRRYRVGKKD
jgi:hypothetical protein